MNLFVCLKAFPLRRFNGGEDLLRALLTLCGQRVGAGSNPTTTVGMQHHEANVTKLMCTLAHVMLHINCCSDPYQP